MATTATLIAGIGTLPTLFLMALIAASWCRERHDNAPATLHHCSTEHLWQWRSERHHWNGQLEHASYQSARLLIVLFTEQSGNRHYLNLPADAVSGDDFSYLVLNTQTPPKAETTTQGSES